MNGSVEESFTEHGKRTERLLASRKNRMPEQGKALFYAFELYSLFNSAFDHTSISKHHMIGLAAFMEGIAEPKEQGGIILKSHLEMLEKLAHQLALWIRPDLPTGTAVLFEKSVVALLICCTALSAYAAEQMKKGPKKFREELMLRYLFGTGGLRELFLSPIEGLDGDKMRSSAAAELLEALALGIALFYLQGENVEEEVVHGIRPILLNRLERSKEAVSVLGSEAMGIVEAMIIALNAQDYSHWVDCVREMLTISGSEMASVNEDLNEIGRITKTVLETYQTAKENRPNLVHMIG